MTRTASVIPVPGPIIVAVRGAGIVRRTLMNNIREMDVFAIFGVTSKPVVLTISAGLSSLANEHESLDGLLFRADQAMYQAKEAGRNRVVAEPVSGDMKCKPLLKPPRLPERGMNRR